MTHYMASEHRTAVTRLTSGEDDHVTVTVINDDGSEEKRNLTVHPFARLIPLIGIGDLDRLTDDIRDRGVIEPLIMFEGKVLDGRNRLAVAAVTGSPVRLKNFDGTRDEARAFVWSANAARRHLTIPQIALAAERFGFVAQAKAEAPDGEPRGDSYGHHPAAPWANLVAKRVGGITPHTLERFDAARVSEAPDTMARIDSGDIRRVDIAVKEAVAERSVITGQLIMPPAPIPRSAWDRLGCARGDVLAAEKAVADGGFAGMTAAQFAERAREIQGALIRIQNMYRYGTHA